MTDWSQFKDGWPEATMPADEMRQLAENALEESQFDELARCVLVLLDRLSAAVATERERLAALVDRVATSYQEQAAEHRQDDGYPRDPLRREYANDLEQRAIGARSVATTARKGETTA